DAGAAADVEQASPLERREELERQPRRRMRARSECAAGVDHDGDRIARRLSPGRADPQPCNLDRLMKRPPAVLPAAVHLAAGCVTERLPDALLATGIGVRHQLDTVVLLGLLDSFGNEVD